MLFNSIDVLAGMTLAQMNNEVKLGDADVLRYYEEHKAEFEQVQARHILVRMQGSPVPVRPGQKELTDAEALAKAQDLRKKLEAGADFAALAVENSDDTGSGAKGGDLGTFRQRQMVPEFEKAAFALKVGELSQPVKTQFGYHLIKVESHSTRKLDEVKPELEQRLRPELARKAMEELERNAGASLDPEYFGLAK
jgi:parvulin-like peptidyl-prolyl isomerase